MPARPRHPPRPDRAPFQELSMRRTPALAAVVLLAATTVSAADHPEPGAAAKDAANVDAKAVQDAKHDPAAAHGVDASSAEDAAEMKKAHDTLQSTVGTFD